MKYEESSVLKTKGRPTFAPTASSDCPHPSPEYITHSPEEFTRSPTTPNPQPPLYSSPSLCSGRSLFASLSLSIPLVPTNPPCECHRLLLLLLLLLPLLLVLSVLILFAPSIPSTAASLSRLVSSV
jgi:hypothetical protein